MSFYYDLYPIHDNINEKPKTGLIARAKSRGTIGIDMLSRTMSDRMTFTRAEIRAIIEALIDESEFYLSNGWNVSLGELGTFSIVAQSEIVQKPSDLRGESIQLKRIVFRPGRNLYHRLKSVCFEKINPKLRKKNKK
jgi:Bacterial nucleoid DNA-binding protein